MTRAKLKQLEKELLELDPVDLQGLFDRVSGCFNLTPIKKSKRKNPREKIFSILESINIQDLKDIPTYKNSYKEVYNK